MQDADLDAVLKQWRRERPDLDPTCMAVCGAIWRAGKRLQDGLGPNLARYGLDFAAMDVLLTLRRNGAEVAMRPSDLARDMMLSTPAMTARLDRLETRGLVARRPHPSDRRSVGVLLTAAGLALVEEMVGHHVAAEQAMLADLSAEEQDQLRRLLARVAPPGEPG